MSGYRIPFNRPFLSGRELDYMREAVERGHISGDGPYGQRCEEYLARELGAKRVLLTTSCTHALEMSALLLDIRPGDEVIVPSYTFVSTANAFALRGAKIVFCDVEEGTLNMDPARLSRLLTDKTRAIVPVHYAGIGCDMDAIGALARARGIPVIEDNAHGLFARFRGRPLGGFGALATQSFHETKNFTCGEGGALVLNDESLIARAEIIREKGTNRRQFFRGQVDKYTWTGLGSSYVLADILAAYLWAQLESRELIQGRRRRLWQRYRDALAGWAAREAVVLPSVPAGRESAYHMFHVIFPSLEARTAVIERLKAKGILSVFHYAPLHLSAMGREFGARPGDCPVAESAGDKLLRLPFYTGMTDAEQDDVVAAIVSR